MRRLLLFLLLVLTLPLPATVPRLEQLLLLQNSSALQAEFAARPGIYTENWLRRLSAEIYRIIHTDTGRAEKLSIILLEAARFLNNRPLTAGALYIQGNIQERFTGRQQQALTCYRAAEKLYLSLQQPRWLVETRERIGILLTALHRFDEALQLWQQLGSYARQHNLAWKLPGINNGAGNTALRAGRSTLAEQYYRSALQQAKAGTDNRMLLQQAAALTGIGSIELRQSNYAVARQHFLDALQLYNRTGATAHLGDAVYRIGSTYFRAGDFPNAAIYFQRALINYKQAGQEYALVQTLTTLADALFYSSQIAEAEQTYRYGLDLLQKQRDPGREAALTRSYGRLKYWTGNYDAAFKLYIRAIRLYTDSTNAAGKAAVQTDLASLAQSLGRPKLEKRLLMQAKAVFLTNGDLLQLGNCNQMLANIEMRHSRWTNAEQLLLQALQQYTAMRNRLGQANSFGSLAWLNYRLGKYDEAMQYADGAIPLYRSASSYIGWANVLQTKGHIYSSRQNYLKAVVQYTNALALYDAARNRANKLSTYRSLFHALQKLGQQKEALHTLQQTLETALYLRREAGHSKRRIRIQEQTASTMKELFLAAASFAPEQALLGYEQFRGRSFMEQLQGRQALALAGIPAAETAKWLQLTRQLADKQVILRNSGTGRAQRRLLYREINTLRHRRELLERRFAAQYPKYKALKKPSTPEPAQIRQLLEPGECAAVFCLSGSRLGIWTIARDRPLTFKEISWLSNHRAEIRALRAAIRSGEDAGVPVSRLRLTLLQPLLDQLPADTAALHIFADGNLNIIPWQVLLPEKSRLRLFMQSTLSAFATLRSRPDQASRGNMIPLLAFGGAFYTPNNPDLSAGGRPLTLQERLQLLNRRRSGSDEQWPDLPGSSEEARQLCAIWYPDDPAMQRAACLTGLSASEAAVKTLNSGLTNAGQPLTLASARILHFAVHGKADAAAAETSRLVFTRRQVLPAPALQQLHTLFPDHTKEDGNLYAVEILALRVNADLVIMSACQTGLGKVTGTEGVMGLTRSWFIAGARGVIASLWNVSDIGTKVFMTLLHRSLAAGTHPATALQQTAELLKSGRWRRGEFAPEKTFTVRGHTLEYKQLDLSHPSFWGAFQYWGR